MHDLREVVEGLRDHLARHDKPLSFLFGAGTSSAVNVAPPPKPGAPRLNKPLIPAVAALTVLCKQAVNALGPDFVSAWKKAEVELAASLPSGPANIELLLSLVRRKAEAAGPHDMLLGLTPDGLKTMEQVIRGTIAQTVNPSEATIPKRTPHDDFAAWIQRTTRTQAIEVFTTNYDVLLERALENAHLPVTDGFVGSYRPFFRADLIEREELLPRAPFVRLWKIHGSVNWHLSDGGHTVTRGAVCDSGEMIFPTHRKYDESRQQPYLALLTRLRTVLNRDDALLVTSGYSFSDQHINSVIFSALDTRPRSHVVALIYGELSATAQLASEAGRRKNLLVLGRNAAVISGQWGQWRLRDAVDDPTAPFMDLAFDSDAIPAPETPAVTGHFRLGDFVWLAKFLAAMKSSDALTENAP